MAVTGTISSDPHRSPGHLTQANDAGLLFAHMLIFGSVLR